jgi:TPR repeat protein
LAGLLLAPAHAQPDAAQLIAECDRLAASDMDATRPASVPGVATPSIDASAALKACVAAAKAAPADARILFQLGRALHAARQPDKARAAYQFADKRDHAGAAVNLGIQFANGTGGPRDLSEARRLYEKAAKAGHPSAIHLLADMHASGNGVPKDGAQAQRLYLEALPIFEKYAAAGSSTAMFVLGGMHENGRGTTRDVALAKQWYEKALAAGYQPAAQSLERLKTGQPPAPAAQQQPTTQPQKPARATPRRGEFVSGTAPPRGR